jgi:3-hydroxybutyryl-CoA dehydratase
VFDKWFEELAVGDARSFAGVTVTEAHVVGFAGVTGDNYPLHMDAEFAASTPFGQRVAHGLLVLSLGAGLIPMTPGIVAALLGMEEVRFVAPVFIGDTVHPEMEVLEATARGDGPGRVRIAERIVNQRDETVVTAVIDVLVNRRGAGDGG